MRAPPAASSRLLAGIDLVEIAETQRSIERFGDRFLNRVFTASELAVCQATPSRQCERLAARFAAKEATMKVLRLRDEGLSWRSIEVETSEGGWSELRLHGKAADLAAAAGISDLSLSMSHSGGLATAVVIATRDKAASP